MKATFGQSAWETTAIDLFWLHLVAKMLATALVVVVATVAAERVGAFWGALIASLPVAAGPLYVLLALEHDAEFLAQSAIGSLAATAATGCYMLALTQLCPRLPAPAAIPLGLCVWLACAAAIRALPWTLVSGAALAAGTLLTGMAVTVQERRWTAPKAAARRWYDVPSRAATVAVLVALVTTVSRVIGPDSTGFIAVFPVAMTSLAVIIHLRQGGRAVATIMATSFLPMLGFVLALSALSLTASADGADWGLGWGLAAGLTGSLGWSLVLVAWRLASGR